MQQAATFSGSRAENVIELPHFWSLGKDPSEHCLSRYCSQKTLKWTVGDGSAKAWGTEKMGPMDCCPSGLGSVQCSRRDSGAPGFLEQVGLGMPLLVSCASVHRWLRLVLGQPGYAQCR